MLNFAIALFLCDAVLGVHRLDARQAHHVVSTTDDVALTDDHGKSDFRRNASLLSDDIFLAAVARPDASLVPATSPFRLQGLTMLEKKLATSANWSLEKQITYRKPILGTTSFNLNTKP